VAVDIRRSSPTFGRWVGYELSEKNKHILYIPAGFAHGFQVLSEIAEVAYKASVEYNAASERGLIWDDPKVKIEWPLERVVLSDKDSGLPNLDKAELFD